MPTVHAIIIHNDDEPLPDNLTFTVVPAAQLGFESAAPTGPTDPSAYKRLRSLQNVNIRSSPSTSGGRSTVTGLFMSGDTTELLQTLSDDSGNWWARIGYKQFCAIQYNGVNYTEVLE